MSYKATEKGVIETLLPALTTTGTGVAKVVPITSKNLRVHSKGTGTITGGSIVIEEASTPDYSGTWSVITTITAADLTGGAQQVSHIFGTIGAIRARIGDDIEGGGSVGVDLVSD